MFCKEIKKKISDFEAFEKGVCKIIDGYFKTNNEAEVRYSMDNAVDKFWHFVKSVDDRIGKFEKALADCELVSKDWHDEQIGHYVEENARLEKRNSALLIEKEAMEANCIALQKQLDEVKP